MRLPRQEHYLQQGVPAERRLSTTRLCAILTLDSSGLCVLFVLVMIGRLGRHRAAVGFVSLFLLPFLQISRLSQKVLFTIYGFPNIIVSAHFWLKYLIFAYLRSLLGLYMYKRVVDAYSSIMVLNIT